MSKQKKESPPSFFAKWVVKGKGHVPLYFAGKTEQLETKNGVYKFTESDMEPGRCKALKDALKKVGFDDVTRNRGRTHKRVERKYSYKLIHPEHAPGKPVNRKIAFQMLDSSGNPMYDKEGKPVTKIVTLKDGICKTEDKNEYLSLLRAGMKEINKTIIPKGKDK
jgi:hypothetical protein